MNKQSKKISAGKAYHIVAFCLGMLTMICWMLSQSSVADEVPPRAEKRAGVTLLKRDKCYDGYRLYSSRGTEAAHIIDLDGREVLTSDCLMAIL